jgi:hypothetical protein
MVEKRGGEELALANKLLLKRAVEHKINVISEKAFISEKEVYELIRGFFKKYINIDYEFTSEELLKEMKKIYLPNALQEKVKSILERISEIEHVSRTFTKPELIAILNDFKTVVDEIIVVHYDSKGFAKKLGDALHLGFSKKHETVLDEATLLNENERIVVKMNVLLDNARRLAEKDSSEAKKSYLELMNLYNSLDDQKKMAYYKPVSELYALLKNKGI